MISHEKTYNNFVANRIYLEKSFLSTESLNN